MTTAPSWMTAAEAAAFERGTTAADAAGAGVAHHEPAQPAFDPDYRPQAAGHPYVAKPKSPKRTNTTSTMDDAA